MRGHEQPGARRTRIPNVPHGGRPSRSAGQVPQTACTCGVFRQRGVRIAEKPGQAPRDSCVVTSGVFFAECAGQLICPRRRAVAQEQPGGLEVLNVRDALQSRSWATRLMRSWRCTKASVPSACPARRDLADPGATPNPRPKPGHRPWPGAPGWLATLSSRRW